MGFSTFLLWLSLGQPFPEQMPLIQEVLLPPLYLSAGYTAPPGSIAVVKPLSRDKQFRVWSHCRPALETSCNCFSSLLHPQFC